MSTTSTAQATKEQGDEKSNRNFTPPPFTFKELKHCVPPQLFERDGMLSTYYVARDVLGVIALLYAATFIETSLPYYARFIAWPVYWVLQGNMGVAFWVLAHECGHHSLWVNENINNIVGYALHSVLLVPYYSWKFSHSSHHKGIQHMERDNAFVPKTRSFKFPQKPAVSPDTDHHKNDMVSEMMEETPIANLIQLVMMLLIGWPLYLLVNTSGQKHLRWTSHFHPGSALFHPDQGMHVNLSTIGVLATAAGLWYAASVYSSAAVLKFYGVPYFLVNVWLVLITYLQHTSVNVPHFRGKEWSFSRGALCTIDRSFGILDNWFHHITDSHLAHHLFATMPFYNAIKATPYLKAFLGKYYLEDNRFFLTALWETYRECKFVEDEGDVAFYKKYRGDFSSHLVNSKSD